MSKLLKSRYEIGEKIGEDHFSITYLGRSLDATQKVVVRIYKRYLLDSVAIQELKTKAAALAQLHHPRIARVLDGDYGWQGFYFVREFVEGMSLAEFVRKQRGVSPDMAIDIMCQVAEAVAYAHHAGVVHGGLHPSNVLVGYDQSIQVADFMIDGMIRSTATQTALTVIQGSPFFTPEQTMGEPLSPASDQYLMGALLYWLVTGSPPFQNGERSGLVQALRRVRERSPQLGEQNGVQHFFNDLFQIALAPDPLERFSGAEAFLACLKSRAVRREPFHPAGIRIRYTQDEQEEPAPLVVSPHPLRRRMMEKMTKEEKGAHTWLRALLTMGVICLAGFLGYAFVQIIWFQ